MVLTMGDCCDKEITVCDECLRAACWKGYFYCDKAKYAGITKMTKGELLKLNLEHPSYWEDEDVFS